MITAKIDVTKIEKARLYKGEKGTYLDILLIPREDEWGNSHMVVQSVSKQEREAGVRGPILGNAKTVIPIEKATKQIQNHVEKTHTEDGEEIPF